MSNGKQGKPLPLTAKQRSFVAYRIAHPTATDTECAIAAGYSPTNTAMGHDVANAPAVVAAVQAAQSVTMAQAGLSREGHLSKLEELRDAALQAGQHSAAITAEVHRGKVGGFYEDRVKFVADDVKKMTPEQLELAAKRLGLV